MKNHYSISALIAAITLGLSLPVYFVSASSATSSDSIARHMVQKYNEASDLTKKAKDDHKEAVAKKKLAGDAMNTYNDGLKVKTDARQKAEGELNSANDKLSNLNNRLTQILAKKADPGDDSATFKSSLDGATNVLKGARDSLKLLGASEADVTKIFNGLGVNPDTLAKSISETSGTVHAMTVGEFVTLIASLKDIRTSVTNARDTVSNSLGTERQTVATLDKTIDTKKKEKKYWEDDRDTHNGKAGGYDALCKANWISCTWNTPKALVERAIALRSQIAANLADAEVTLNLGYRFYPALKVSFVDTISGNIYGSVIGTLDSKISSAESSLQALRSQEDTTSIKAAIDLATAEVKRASDVVVKATKDEKAFTAGKSSLDVNNAKLISDATALDTKATGEDAQVKKLMDEYRTLSDQYAAARVAEKQVVKKPTPKCAAGSSYSFTFKQCMIDKPVNTAPKIVCPFGKTYSPTLKNCY